MRKIVIGGIVVAVLVAFIGTLFFLWSKSQGDPEVFEHEEAALRDIVQKTVATGAIEPRREVAIKPRVSGVVAELYLEPGQPVKEGDLIAKIRLIPDAVRVNDAESAVRSARISTDNAKKEMERYENLKGVVSDAEIARQRVQYDLRKQELDSAQRRLQLVREGTSSTTGQASTQVTSTVTGMVLDVPVKLGESVIESNTFNAGTTIATVADMGDMIFTGWVDEAEVGKLREGMKLDIRVGALEEQIFEGKLEYIAPKSRSNNGAIQFEVRAAVVQRDDAFLRAGYSANADIVLERRDQAIALNERGLQFEEDDEGEQLVYVEVETGPQQYERRTIETGLSDGLHIEIVAGLESGDNVKVPSMYASADATKDGPETKKRGKGKRRKKK